MTGTKFLDKRKKSVNTDIHKSTIFKRIWRYRYFYMFILPAIIWFFIFKYVPMYGITLGFKEYRFDKGILGSDWVGLRYVKQFINHYDFWMLIRNTRKFWAIRTLHCFVPMSLLERKSIRMNCITSVILILEYTLVLSSSLYCWWLLTYCTDG